MGSADERMVFNIPQNLNKICTILWPSGIVLAEVVSAQLSDICAKGCRVLELGCGSALPSMVAALLGANAVATDMDLTAVSNAMSRNRETLAAGKGSMTTE